MKDYFLYTDSTPNGFKISIALEELGVDYDFKNVDFSIREQKTPEFLQINPNGKIPVLIDHGRDDLTLFESGAILQYLADKHGQLLPQDPAGRAKAIQWLTWQMAGLGPMFGQFLVFAIPFENSMPKATKRYQLETMRLLSVLNDQLKDSQFITGEHSIADIACYPWVAMMERAEWSMPDFPNLNRWFKELSARPAYQAGMNVPGPKPEEQRMKGFRDATVGAQ